MSGSRVAAERKCSARGKFVIFSAARGVELGYLSIKFGDEYRARSGAETGGNLARSGGREMSDFAEVTWTGRFELVESCFVFKAADEHGAGGIDGNAAWISKRFLTQISPFGGKDVQLAVGGIGDVYVSRGRPDARWSDRNLCFSRRSFGAEDFS